MLKKRIIIASSKGGVGKSTASCGIAFALASMGYRVLLVDCDFGNRCLDIMLSVENDTVYNLGDVMTGRIKAADAAIRLSEYGELYFVPAPPCLSDEPDLSGIGDALKELEKAVDAEYVICDTSSGVTVPVTIAREYADTALIVATQLPTSLRAAENLAVMLDGTPVKEIRLLISVFDADGVTKGDKAGIISMIMKSSVQAIGAVPYEYRLTLSPLPPKSIYRKRRSPAQAAFNNIAKRLDGYDIPLFDGIRSLRRRLTL